MVQLLGRYTIASGEAVEATTNTVTPYLFVVVEHFKSVECTVRNFHATNNINWEVYGWRTKALGSNRATALPVDGTTHLYDIIQAVEAVGALTANVPGQKTEEIADNKDYTHIAIAVESTVDDTASDNVIIEVWGRPELS